MKNNETKDKDSDEDLNEKDDLFRSKRESYHTEQNLKAQRGMMILSQNVWKIKDIQKELDYSMINLIIFIAQKALRDRKQLSAIATDELFKGRLFTRPESSQKKCFVTVHSIYLCSSTRHRSRQAQVAYSRL